MSRFTGSIFDGDTPKTIVVSRVLGAVITAASMFLMYAMLSL